MKEWLGPSTGSPLLDFFTRHLALDLFVNPAGMRFLAVTMLGKAVEQPCYPETRECLLGVFESVLARRDVELDFAGIEATCGEAVLHFLPDDGTRFALATKISHLMDGRRWRALLALSALLMLPDAWESSHHSGIHEQLSARVFRGAFILQHFYNPQYLALLMLEHLFSDVAPKAVALNTNDPHWRMIIHDLATLLARHHMDEAARVVEKNAGDRDELAAAVRGLARGMCDRMRKMGRLVLFYWDKERRESQ